MLDAGNHLVTVDGEQLDGLLGRLVGAQKAKAVVVARAVDARGHDIVQRAHDLGACLLQDTLGARPGVDIAGQDGFGVVQDGTRVVGKDDLCLSAGLFDELLIIGDVIYAGKDMGPVAKMRTVLRKAEHIAPGVDALFIYKIGVDQMVADLIGRIAEHEHDLFAAHGDALEADGKAVAAENGENYTHGAAAELGADIGRDVLHARIVALGARHDGLGHGDDVAVLHGERRALGGGHDRINHDLRKVVSCTDDRGTDAARYCTDHSFHSVVLFFSYNRIMQKM